MERFCACATVKGVPRPMASVRMAHGRADFYKGRSKSIVAAEIKRLLD
jgi:hypothetical protein